MKTKSKNKKVKIDPYSDKCVSNFQQYEGDKPLSEILSADSRPRYIEVTPINMNSQIKVKLDSISIIQQNKDDLTLLVDGNYIAIKEREEQLFSWGISPPEV